MKRRLYLIVLSVGSLALGASIGYFYRDRSAEFASYDRHIFDLSMTVLMSDALRHKKYDLLEKYVAAEIERATSGMVLLYDRYKFHERELLRCAVTRKARVLYENKKILVSREKLEELDYPYDQVKAYFESNCEGQPSHDDWTAVGKPTKEKK
jgi:hypothetical protein